MCLLSNLNSLYSRPSFKASPPLNILLFVIPFIYALQSRVESSVAE